MSRYTSAVLAFGRPASASIIFTQGNNPQQPGEQNILFGAPETGTAIHGATQSGISVDFTSTQTLYQKAQGQAQILGTDQNPDNVNIDNLIITTPGSTFTDFIMDPNKGSGSATVTVNASDGVFSTSYLLGNGENYLTIVAADNETISSIDLSAPGGFEQFKQPRISGLSSNLPPVVPVPEPGSILLLGTGIAGLALVGRSRKALAQAAYLTMRPRRQSADRRRASQAPPARDNGPGQQHPGKSRKGKSRKA